MCDAPRGDDQWNPRCVWKQRCRLSERHLRHIFFTHWCYFVTPKCFLAKNGFLLFLKAQNKISTVPIPRREEAETFYFSSHPENACAPSCCSTRGRTKRLETFDWIHYLLVVWVLQRERSRKWGFLQDVVKTLTKREQQPRFVSSSERSSSVKPQTLCRNLLRLWCHQLQNLPSMFKKKKMVIFFICSVLTLSLFKHLNSY